MKNNKIIFKKIYLLGLAPIGFILTLIAKYNVFFAEEIMSKRIYKIFSGGIYLFTGILPFSLAELIIIISPVIILLITIRFINKIYKSPTSRGLLVKDALLNIGVFLSISYFAFIVLCGINYYRHPFAYHTNLEVQDSTVEELYELAKDLVKDVNSIKNELEQLGDSDSFKLSKTINETAKDAQEAFNSIGEEYEVLRGRYPFPKPVLFSKFMSRAEITGIFIPYTVEANVNVDAPDFTIPFTMSHELAHLSGFMREDEANYIAYLVSIGSESKDFNYSGSLSALIMTLDALYAQDYELYFELRNECSEGVNSDLRYNSAYWSQFEDTSITVISNKVNDNYLKMNNQKDGVKSYGRMLDLMLAKRRV